jgi:S-DNA-T family DNA segregation ATPase FtsK/SpoIIIE
MLYWYYQGICRSSVVFSYAPAWEIAFEEFMAQKKKKKKKTDSRTNEIIGIVVIGLAAFAAVTVYFNIDSVFGGLVKDLLFGMCGVIGYVAPILAAAVGVLVIAARNKYTNPGKLALLALTLFLVFSIAHVGVTEQVFGSRSGWGEFIGHSYDIGVLDKSGGGAIGSILPYWTYRYLRVAGSYIVCVVGLAACLLLLTNLSLRKISNDIGKAVRTTYDGYRNRAEEKREQRRLYIESLELEEQEKQAKEKENRFDLRIRSLDDSINKRIEELNMEEGQDPFEEYDPEPYREVFADTDIVFEDEVRPEVKGRRRIDPSAQTVPLRRAPGNTRPASPVSEAARRPDMEETAPRRIVREKRNYVRPPLNLLTQTRMGAKSSAADLRKNVEILESTLLSFNVNAKVVNVSRGPVVTRYEVQPAPGVKVSKIVNLSDDIAMNLSARDVRIEAPVPGKPVVGIEVPNNKTSFVGLRELMATEQFRALKSPVSFALGKDIAGGNVYADIARMPHVLIAGATGSGKSVCINSLIVSILYHASPEDVRMIMIDPKVVELNAYNGIPHLMHAVVTEAKKAASTINWAVNEMTMRYRLFAKKGAKDLAKYNETIMAEGEEKLPQILVIIDELADLMMVSAKEVEDAICRIAQLGRASGIHLVIATQRPSVDVITGIIKANIPSRIAFAVSSQIDSRTILDMQGAEKLLGQGDMLFYPTGAPKPVRLQGCFISETEVEAVTDFLKERSEPDYDTRIEESIARESAETIAGQDEKDELFLKAIELVVEYEQASTSMLQRRLRLGYARAARLIDQLEENNIVSPADGSKPRQVLISRETFRSMQMEEERGNFD